MNELLKENDYLKTNELSLVATLQVFGYELESVEKGINGRATFYIKRDGHLDDIISSFWLRKLKVEPLAFFESMKVIKSRIYQ
jgi:hypothetical protein